MKQNKNIKEIIILAVLTSVWLVLSGLQYYVSSYYNIDKGYEWDGNAYTTTGLPIMVAECDFYHSGYYGNSCEKNIMLYGDSTDNWVNCGGPGIGDNKELYPNSLKILYYSFNENKFYGGSFQLNYDTIISKAEKMRKAVQSEDNGRTESINFNTKVYPLGKIVVSMESYIGTTLGEEVIAVFQTTPQNHDWSVFNKDDNSEIERGVSNSKSIITQRALLLNKYNWQIEILLPEGNDFKSLDVDVYGSRRLEMDTIKSAKLPTFYNFIYLPQRLVLEWQRKDTISFYTDFKFEEQDVITAFDRLKASNKNLPIKMKIIVKDDSTVIKAILFDDTKIIELKNLDSTEIYSSKIYH